MRKVINKMVTEEDLIRTVSAAYSHGWRQVKLYFMCGLPTETDEDVVAIADLARKVIKAGREATGRRDVRCTVSIGAFIPKPHTPFQWAAQAGHETVDARLRSLGGALRATPGYGRAVGYRYHDGKPSIVEGLLSRGDRRVAKVIKAACGRRPFTGGQHFSSSVRCTRGAGLNRWTWTGTPPGSGTTARSPDHPRRTARPATGLAGLQDAIDPVAQDRRPPPTPRWTAGSGRCKTQAGPTG
jgi:hypothetical protein